MGGGGGGWPLKPLTTLLRLVILLSMLSFVGSLWPKIYENKMRAFFAATFSLFAVSLIQTAAGLNCDSLCAACWMDNNADGADIKFTCLADDGYCGETCPVGYHGMHCANHARCR